MLPQPTVFLFDIDGTLLSAGGAGRIAFERAFSEVVGSSLPIKKMDFRGMTDLAMTRGGLAMLGLAFETMVVDSVLARYLVYLEDALAHSHEVAVYPGVVRLLERISQCPEHWGLGLGTGNIENGAFAKLRTASLDHYFAFGGYGSDSELRPEVLRIGSERGFRHLGKPPDKCRVIVIGDTVRDVDAARAIGASCIAVGTGGTSLDALEASGADLAVPTLVDDRVERFILGRLESTGSR